MAKKKKPAESGGETKVTNFRLEAETLENLDVIAQHYTAEVGIKVTRAGAIRIAARNERRRIKPDEKS